jgi:Predicted membrane protein (DUF2142)
MAAVGAKHESAIPGRHQCHASRVRADVVDVDLDQKDRAAASLAPVETRPAAPQSLGRLAGRRLVWWFGFLTFACLAGIWALATPINGAPDEREHVIRAAAVARGQLVGQNGAYVNGTGALVRAPADLSAIMVPAYCFAFHQKRTADCARPLAAPATVKPQPSGAGRYFPVYYGIVGLPTLAIHGVASLYLIRFLSMLVSAALVASALTSAAQWRRSPLLVTGLYAAVVPMALFLFGVVNPNSWEIAAALCLWTSSLALLFAEDCVDDSSLLTRIGVAALILVSMRSLSPLWLTLVVLLVALAAVRGRLMEILLQRRAMVWSGAVLGVTLLQVAWTIRNQALDIGHLPAPGHLSLADRLETSILLVPGRLHDMVGVFGWLDTNSPALTYLLWAAGVGAVVLLGLAGAARLPRAALVGVMVLTIAVPIASEVPGANMYGFAWQGRYTLPLAVGVPILAGLAAAVGGTLGPRAAIRLTAWLAILLGVAQFFAFWWMLLRYQVGEGNGLDPRVGSWHPPGGSLLILSLYGLGLLSWGVLASMAWRLAAGWSPSPAGAGLRAAAVEFWARRPHWGASGR